MINLEINVPYKAKEFFMEVIGEEPKKSVNSKNRQLRLAEEKCDFYTTGKGRGMKYIITEIYSPTKNEIKRQVCRRYENSINIQITKQQ